MEESKTELPAANPASPAVEVNQLESETGLPTVESDSTTVEPDSPAFEPDFPVDAPEFLAAVLLSLRSLQSKPLRHELRGYNLRLTSRDRRMISLGGMAVRA